MREELEDREGPGTRGDDGDEDRRPTPVRLVMEAGGKEKEPGEEVEPRRVRDPKTNKEWVVSVTGRSGSGILPLRSVPIMEVAFSDPDDPKRPIRRAMAIEGDLETISDQVLLESLGRSRPFTEPLQERGDGERRGRGGRGRRSRRS